MATTVKLKQIGKLSYSNVKVPGGPILKNEVVRVTEAQAAMLLAAHSGEDRADDTTEPNDTPWFVEVSNNQPVDHDLSGQEPDVVVEEKEDDSALAQTRKVTQRAQRPARK